MIRKVFFLSYGLFNITLYNIIIGSTAIEATPWSLGTRA